MKGIKLSLAIVSLFSLFLIVYFNSFSIAQDVTENELKVESEVYKQLQEKGFANVIVKLSDDSSSEDLNRVIKNSKSNIKELSEEIESIGGNIEIIHAYEAFNSLSIRVDEKTLETLKQSKFVQEIFAERMLEIQHQQSMPLINATQAWNSPVTNTTNLTGVGSMVCLIDTGVDYNHVALGGAWGVKVIGGFDFVNNDTNPIDDNGHGTHLAGIIAGKGMVGTTLFRGVAPDAYIIAEKVCNQNGSCSNANILAGMNHCLTTISPRKLSVISISIGDGGSYSNISNTCPTWMDAAINTSYNNGIPVIVSAGNQAHKNGISYPACNPQVISVGATYDSNIFGGIVNWSICTDSNGNATLDRVACASNTGNNLKMVAPGAQIVSTATTLGLPGSCGYTSAPNSLNQCKGSSQAAAHVAGAVALLKQKYRSSLGPGTISSQRIEKMLRVSNKFGTDPANGMTFPRLSLERFI